jgi:hypothetical protein
MQKRRAILAQKRTQSEPILDCACLRAFAPLRENLKIGAASPGNYLVEKRVVLRAGLLASDKSFHGG